MAENSWITEGLVQFSESPLWKTPVENFIDDNCCVFSTDSEMKLEYTIVHQKFRELIDSLLTSCVMELDVPMDAAVEALRESLNERSHEYHARTQRHAAKKMLTQVFSADNFSSFYTMMVKRNLELDILASASLAAQGVDLEGNVDATHNLAALHEDSGATPARVQRALDANGDLGEDEALHRAIEASLQDPQSQEQMRIYSEVCAQETVELKIENAEREAQHQKTQLEEALRDRAGSPEVEQYRKERLAEIDQQKDSQLQEIHSCILSGPKQSFYHDRRRPTAEFSCPENAEPPTPSPEPLAINQAPDVVPPLPAPAVAPSAQQPQLQQQQSAASSATSAAVTLPSIGHQQGALPSIARKTNAAGAIPSNAAAMSSAITTNTYATAAAAVNSGAIPPSKKELERRAEYMRQQREMILARNRASRQEQLNSYVQQAQQPSAGSAGSSAAAAAGSQNDLTVEIARRLRGDLVGEGRKATS